MHVTHTMQAKRWLGEGVYEHVCVHLNGHLRNADLLMSASKVSILLGESRKREGSFRRFVPYIHPLPKSKSVTRAFNK